MLEGLCNLECCSQLPRQQRLIRWNGWRYQHVLALCVLLTRVILNRLFLQKFVFYVCRCNIYILSDTCVGTEFVHLTSMDLAVKRDDMFLTTEFEPRYVTLCGWQDGKIQSLTLSVYWADVSTAQHRVEFGWCRKSCATHRWPFVPSQWWSAWSFLVV